MWKSRRPIAEPCQLDCDPPKVSDSEHDAGMILYGIEYHWHAGRDSRARFARQALSHRSRLATVRSAHFSNPRTPS
jgi:hypothetical protein